MAESRNSHGSPAHSQKQSFPQNVDSQRTPEVDANILGNLLVELLKKRGAGEPQEDNILDRISRHNPPRYHGEMGPVALEDWVREMEKLFKAANVPTARRVDIAAYYLKGPADLWWGSIESKASEPGFTWESFKTQLRDKFYPTSLRLRKQEEFLKLAQGTMSVSEYAERFHELSRFAPDFVASDTMKMQLFEKGLNLRLRQQLAAQIFTSYQELFDQATRVEHVMGYDRNEAISAGNKRKNGRRSGPSYGEAPKRQFTGSFSHQMYQCAGSKSMSSMGQRLKCAKCGRENHTTAECHHDTSVCYLCKRPGHIRIDCPARMTQAQPSYSRMTSANSHQPSRAGQSSRATDKPQQPRQQQPRRPDASGRVFIMNQDMDNVTSPGLYPLHHCKIIHLVRHAQGLHNIEGEKNYKAYMKPEYFDAPLTPLGWQQVDNLRKHVLACGLNKRIELIITSPLLRTMQTAVGVFGGEGYTDRMDVLPLMVANAGSSNRSAISSLNCPPITAFELCREHLGVHPCDKRRRIQEYHCLFPAVDFSLIETDEDALWKSDVRETKAELAERGMKFMNWLLTRKEKEIAVVTHSGFLAHTLNQFGNECPPLMKNDLSKRFANCELRSMILVDRNMTVPVASTTNYPGKIPHGPDHPSDVDEDNKTDNSQESTAQS